MNKRHILPLLFGFAFMFSLSSCKKDEETTESTISYTETTSVSYTETTSVHVHSWSTEKVIEATCTTPEKTIYRCTSCGETKTEETSKPSHDYGNGVVLSERSCTEDGVIEYTCLRCGDTKTVTLKACHNIIHHNYQAPTCLEAGWKAYDSCARCDYTTKEEIPPTGHHVYSSGEVTIPPSCGNGVMTYTCTSCGRKIMDPIEGTGNHKYRVYDATDTMGYISKMPTCTEEGLRTYVCADCGYSYTAPIDKLDHDYVTYTKTSYCGLEYSYTICKTGGEFEVFMDGNYMEEYIPYANFHMYDSLSELDDALKLQEFYIDMTVNCLEFQFAGPDVSDVTAFTLDYDSYGITISQAQAVWASVEHDWPIFYWMANSVKWDDGIFIVKTEEAFYSADARDAYNEMVLDGIRSLISEIKTDDDLTTVYNLYKKIIETTDYAYDDEGKASEELNAHSVLGFFNGEDIVCEGYAKLIQIVLNQIGIDNYYIVGTAGGAHGWNYVYLYNGWYLLDVTWDDDNDLDFDYFLLDYSEAEKINHVPFTYESGVWYMCDLPGLSSAALYPVALYEGDTLVGCYPSFLKASLAMTNEDGDYSIYLCDKDSGFAYRTDYEFYNLPAVKSLCIYGNSQAIHSCGYLLRDNVTLEGVTFLYDNFFVL